MIKKTILLLAANPINIDRLLLDKEAKEIEENLRRAKCREQFQIESQWAATPEDLYMSLGYNTKIIIHFWGDGSSEGIILENEDGEPSTVDEKLLQDILSVISVECVLLYACYLERQAKAISEKIKFVIGLPSKIKDDHARIFSVRFYDALGAGKSVDHAYEIACNLLYIKGVQRSSIPKLLRSNEPLTVHIPRLSVSPQEMAALISIKLKIFFNAMKQYTSFINKIIMCFCVLMGFIVGLFIAPYYPHIISMNPLKTDTQGDIWPPDDGVLEAIRDRGYLRCGIEGTLPYFSKIHGRPSKDGEFDDAIGFDADYCRVIAVSVFGEDYSPNSSVKFIRTKSNDRFAAVLSGRIDVLIRNTTHTVGRHIASDIEFGPTIFYDTQDILVKKDINNFMDLNGKQVCVISNSTSKQNLESEIASRSDIYLEVTDKNLGNDDITYNDLLTAGFRSDNNQFCDAISADRSQLISILNDDEKLLGEIISKEPLAPAYISGDKQWSHIVDYSIYATIYAAELGITKAEVDKISKNTLSLSIKQFLGVDDDRIKDYIGPELNVDQKFIYFIIENVGNYKDIYDKNFIDEGRLIFTDTINSVYNPNTGEGLLYSPPFTFPDEDELIQFK